MKTETIVALSIAGYGALLSTWTAYARWRERRPRLEVSLTRDKECLFAVADESVNQEMLYLSLVNTGLHPITVVGHGVLTSNDREIEVPLSDKDVGIELPQRVEPGGTLTLSYAVDILRSHLQEAGLGGTVVVHGFVTVAARKRRHKSSGVTLDV